MNLILLTEQDFTSGPEHVRLTGRRCEHVLRVHRAKRGDTLRVGVLNGRVGTGTITDLGATALEMSIVLDTDPPAPLPVTLLLALPRPKSFRKALHAATVMGVKRIVLMNAYRVEKSFWQSPLLKETRLRAEMVLALEQGSDTMLPVVSLEKRLKPFVEDRLPALARGTRSLLAHPAASTPCPRALDGPVTLAVGPEGGFILYEVELFEKAGFQPVSLGNRILRVEQAIPALLGRLF